MPIHHAAIRRRSASGLSSCLTRGVHRPVELRLFALSMFSTSCSKLSKAVSLLGSVASGCSMTVMASRIRSASEGPPMRALRASVSMGRTGGGGCSGSESLEAAEFSIDHWRRELRPLSAMVAEFDVEWELRRMGSGAQRLHR